jgi:hypothetical protein
MATTKPKRTQSVRITINPELEEMLEGLKKRFRGLDYPELFKLSLSSYYRQKMPRPRTGIKKPIRKQAPAPRGRHIA